MDLSQSTSAPMYEAGLLGLAFHPEYSTNGRFFVYRTGSGPLPGGGNGLYYSLSEFSGFPGDDMVDILKSEKVLILQPDPGPDHNAGTVQFGPDGYLYFSVGDTGPVLDPLRDNLQRLDGGLFRGIFRIDVDNRPGSEPPNQNPSIRTAHYSIPADNPLLGLDSYMGIPMNRALARTEMWAFGMRNPWKFSFHPSEGFIVAGDVGGAQWEELNVISQGGQNFGWPYFEGTKPGPQFRNRLPDIPYSFSYHEYFHGYEATSGNAIIAGHFHAGPTLPNLVGQFIYGDFYSGNIWAQPIDPQSNDSAARPEPTHLARLPFLSTFGIDPSDKGLLVAHFYDGKIYKLIGNTEYNPLDSLPEKLSDLGIFTDLTQQRADPELVPYEPNVPFWSDGLKKKRWVYTPEGQSIQFDASGTALAPTGTLFIKHFDWEIESGGRIRSFPVETRLLLKTQDGIEGMSYQWKDDGTEAFRVQAEGKTTLVTRTVPAGPQSMQWLFPSRTGCQLCHNPSAGYILGFNSRQLNDLPILSHGSGQISRLESAGVIDPSGLNLDSDRVCVPPDDERFTLAHRFKSYTDSNCRACHIPGGQSRENWDARLEVPMSQSGLINIVATPPSDPAFGKLIDTQHPDKSEFFFRIQHRHVFKMPPIASYLVDEEFVHLTSLYTQSFLQNGWAQYPQFSSSISQTIEMQNRRMVFGLAGPKENLKPWIWAVREITPNLIFEFNMPSGTLDSDGIHMKVGVLNQFSQFQEKFVGYELISDHRETSIRSSGNPQLEMHRIPSGSQSILLVNHGQLELHVKLGDGWISMDPIPLDPSVNWNLNRLAVGAANLNSENSQRFDIGEIRTTPVDIQLISPENRHDNVHPILFEISSPDKTILPFQLISPDFVHTFPLSPTVSNKAYGFLPAGEYRNYLIRAQLDGGSLQLDFSLDTFSVIRSSLTHSLRTEVQVIDRDTAENLRSNPGTIQIQLDPQNLNLHHFYSLENGTFLENRLVSSSDGAHPSIEWTVLPTTGLDRTQIIEISNLSEMSFRPILVLTDESSGVSVNLDLNIQQSGMGESHYIKLIIPGGLKTQIVNPDGGAFAIQSISVVPEDQSPGETQQLFFSPVTSYSRSMLPVRYLFPAGVNFGKLKHITYYRNESFIGESNKYPFGIFTLDSDSKSDFIYAIAEYKNSQIAFIPMFPQTSYELDQAKKLRGHTFTSLPGGAWPGHLGVDHFLVPNRNMGGRSNQFSIQDFIHLSSGWDPLVYYPPNLLVNPYSSTGAKLTTFWFHPETIQFRVDSGSDTTYRLSLYFMDVILNGPRTQQVSIRDPLTQELMDQVSMSDYVDGQLHTWTLWGDAEINIQRMNNNTALLNGIFIDSGTSEVLDNSVILTSVSDGWVVGAFGRAQEWIQIESSPDLRKWNVLYQGALDANGLSIPTHVMNFQGSSSTQFFRVHARE
ncbi:MAG: PQQ-dependent sugar dehydrogenase [Verrucomicrobia bacterium]|nr:PQQ-dependent sugar dehydrogenase [Verrucomicrobiota bacterium]